MQRTKRHRRISYPHLRAAVARGGHDHHALSLSLSLRLLFYCIPTSHPPITGLPIHQQLNLPRHRDIHRSIFIYGRDAKGRQLSVQTEEEIQKRKCPSQLQTLLRWIE